MERAIWFVSDILPYMLMNSKHPNGISHSYHLINPCANHFKWNAIGFKVMKFFPIIFNIDLFFSSFLYFFLLLLLLFRCDDGNGCCYCRFFSCIVLAPRIQPTVLLYHIPPSLLWCVCVHAMLFENSETIQSTILARLSHFTLMFINNKCTRSTKWTSTNSQQKENIII